MEEKHLTRRPFNQGFSIMSVLVALGIATIFLTFIMKATSNQGKSARHATVVVDKIAYKRALMGAVDCSATFTSGTTCPSAGFLPVYHTLGHTLIESDGSTKLGDLTVLASCNSTDSGVSVRAARLKDGAPLTSTNPDDYLPDPLHGRKVMFNSAASYIFDDTVVLCPGSGGGSGTGFAGITPVSATSSAALADNQRGCNHSPERARTVVATCPAGETLIGGGGRCLSAGVLGSNANAELTESYPESDTEWRVTCCGATVQSYAYCR